MKKLLVGILLSASSFSFATQGYYGLGPKVLKLKLEMVEETESGVNTIKAKAYAIRGGGKTILKIETRDDNCKKTVIELNPNIIEHFSSKHVDCRESFNDDYVREKLSLRFSNEDAKKLAWAIANSKRRICKNNQAQDYSSYNFINEEVKLHNDKSYSLTSSTCSTVKEKNTEQLNSKVRMSNEGNSVLTINLRLKGNVL